MEIPPLTTGQFPTIRIAQLARMVYQTNHLFSKFIAAADIKEILHALDIKISQYWKDHFTFGVLSTQRIKSWAHNPYIISSSIPYVRYCLHMDCIMIMKVIKKKAIRHLSELPAETNHITAGWAQVGWKATHALQSQSMIQLKTITVSPKMPALQHRPSNP